MNAVHNATKKSYMIFSLFHVQSTTALQLIRTIKMVFKGHTKLISN